MSIGVFTRPVGGRLENDIRGNDNALGAALNALDAATVDGPASATDNAIARYDGTTGKLIQNSGITIADGATGTLSGTNTGDQTSIVGITGTKAQFDTAVTDGNFLYVGDVTPGTLINAQAPGTVSVSTANTMLQHDRLTLASTDRLTAAGTARTILLDFGEETARGPFGEVAQQGSVILGTPKAPSMSFTVLGGYELDITRRLALSGTTRATLQGDANLVLQNAPANSGRITLTGRG